MACASDLIFGYSAIRVIWVRRDLTISDARVCNHITVIARAALVAAFKVDTSLIELRVNPASVRAGCAIIGILFVTRSVTLIDVDAAASVIAKAFVAFTD